MGRGFSLMKRIDADEIALGSRVHPPNPRRSAPYALLRSRRPRHRVEKFTTLKLAKKNNLADLAHMATLAD
jgi:hypothetical protein